MGLLGKLKTKLTLILAAIGGILYALLQREKKQNAEKEADQTREILDDVAVSKQVRDDIRVNDKHDELREKWQRKE